MGFLSRFFGKESKPSKEHFAKVVMERLRAAGETGALDYDPENFRINHDSLVMNLGNAFADYCRCEESDREEILDQYLSAWITSRLEAPEEFEDARPDLYPVLRCRSYFEVEMPLSSQSAEPIDLPYEIIGEHLAVGLVYDLPQSMMSVSSDLLETWGVTFYEAMEVAKANLAASTEGYAKIGELYAVANGDAYDATRILLADLIESFEVDGDRIAMVPNRHTLLVAGSNDIDSLETMLDIVEKELDHERYITGVAFRLCDGNWEPWLPPAGHTLKDP
ncbi:MAG: DUF1444 family protein, partial [Lacipirellulaceae bacterium]